MTIKISRRHALIHSSAFSTAFLTGMQVPSAFAKWLAETPHQPAGPFYHPFEPLSLDNDLVLREGRDQPADGEIIYLKGIIRDQTGKPIPKARVEIWQANAYGRYNHPQHANSNLKIDPNFLGFGHTLTDETGAYRFRSIKPAPYPNSTAWIRPPHIHFAVFPPGGHEWATQMYFRGEKLNATDFLLRRLPNDADRARVIVDFRPVPDAPDPSAALGEFEIVLGMPGVTRDKA